MTTLSRVKVGTIQEGILHSKLATSGDIRTLLVYSLFLKNCSLKLKPVEIKTMIGEILAFVLVEYQGHT